jgi:RND family efflux transporter MFP subunit
VSLSSPQGKTPEQPETFTEAFTEPYRDIAVAASEMGTLSVVKVREGDIVKQGDIIAVMQDDVLRASLEVARRSMSVEGILKSATADFELRKSEQEKLVQLRDRNHASQQEVDRIDTELKVAEARLLSVREELEVKLLEFRRIESQLEQRIVRAPIDGLISDVLREPGEFVSPSEPTIARLVQLDSLLIVFSVPLAQRKDIMKHQKVTLTIGESRQTAEGIVEYVSPTPDSSNSSVRVKVRLPNDEYRFQSGERAVLELNSIRNPSIPPVQPDSTPIARREQ